MIKSWPRIREAAEFVSADGNARSCIWDCTAGRLNWFYEADETVYVIEGGVILKDRAGAARRARPIRPTAVLKFPTTDVIALAQSSFVGCHSSTGHEGRWPPSTIAANLPLPSIRSITRRPSPMQGFSMNW